MDMTAKRCSPVEGVHRGLEYSSHVKVTAHSQSSRDYSQVPTDFSLFLRISSIKLLNYREADERKGYR